jgi:two-component system, cell cycle sensor histidine kinase and response regulator CckA
VLRILLVDDDDDERVLVRDLLSDIPQQRYELRWAPSVPEGIGELMRDRYDACLVDYQLGAHNGFDLLREANERGIQVPFIMLTGMVDTAIDAEAMRLGAYDYLEKSGLTARILERSLRYAVERWRVERRSLEQAERFRTFVANLTEGFFTTDLAGTVQHVNQALADIFGFDDPSQIVGLSCMELVAPTERDGIARLLLEAMTTGVFPATVEFTASRPQGAPRTISLRPAPLLEDGIIVGTQGTVSDVTSRRQMEAELRRHRDKLEAEAEARLAELRSANEQLMRETTERELAQEQLRQAQKMEAIGRLAGGVAHDFNNLLTVIIAFTRLALDDLPAGHPVRQDLSEVLTASDSATKLTGQLLSFARSRPVAPQVVDVCEAIDSAQRMLRRTIGETIDVVVRSGDELLPVLMDPSALDQILFNLAVNARDAMPGGGTLTLGVSGITLASGHALPPGEYVAIIVRDTGCGIDQEHLGKIFEPFYSTKGEQGTGLGLATCYGIAKQARGEISIDSTPGRGTEFTVLLPRVASDASPMVTQKPTSTPCYEGITLVVEDQPSILRMMSRALDEVGFQVMGAQSAEAALAALDKIDSTQLRILVTDVVLPGHTGIWLAKQVRKVHPTMPVLLTSGYTGPGGAIPESDDTTAFLPKPFQAIQLKAKVADLLRQRDPQPRSR